MVTASGGIHHAFPEPPSLTTAMATLSLQLKLPPINKIASITSRWNTYTEDSGNFITEEELKKILGEADYDKMLCITA